MNYAWPGNVRELRNVAERAVLLAKDRITRDLIHEIVGNAMPIDGGDDLPKSLDKVVPLKEYRRLLESQYIGHVLKLADGSVTKAAQALGVDRSHLHQKLKGLSMDP